jgi:hypothetical protein
MPSVSAKQARFMAMMAKDPKRAKAAGIPVKVAREFHAADKRKGTMLGGKREK